MSDLMCACGRGSADNRRGLCKACVKERDGEQSRPATCTRCGREHRKTANHCRLCYKCHEDKWHETHPDAPKCSACGGRIGLNDHRTRQTMCGSCRLATRGHATRARTACKVCEGLAHRRGEHPKDRNGVCHWCGERFEELPPITLEEVTHGRGASHSTSAAWSVSIAARRFSTGEAKARRRALASVLTLEE